MSNVTINPVQSGYNATVISSNFEKLERGINTQVLHRAGGNNRMGQELDMDGNAIYNISSDPANPSSAVTQSQFDNLVAELTAEVAANIGFVVDGDVVLGAGVTLGTASFAALQDNYYSPGEFDTGLKKVLVNGSFGLGAALADNGAYTGDLNSISTTVGLSNTQVRHISGIADNLPRVGEPGYLINLYKDDLKSSQIFISEEGVAPNSEAWDLTQVTEVGDYPIPVGTYAEAFLWGPGGSSFSIGHTNTGIIDHYTLGTPYDLSTRAYVGQVSISAEMGGTSTDNLSGLAWGLNGNSFLACSGSSPGDDKVYEIFVSTPYNPLTKTTFTVHTLSTSLEKQGVWFSDDGLHLAFIRGDGLGAGVQLWTLSVPGDISTAASPTDRGITTINGPCGFAFNQEGTELILIKSVGTTGLQLKKYGLGAPFDTTVLTTLQDITYPTTLYTTAAIIDSTGSHMLAASHPSGVRSYSIGVSEELGSGMYYRVRDGSAWDEWKRFITNKDPANIQSTFTLGGNIDVPIVGGSAIIDCKLGNSFNLDVTEDCIVTFINQPAVGDDYTAKLRVLYGGGFVFGLDAAIKVTGGVLPALSDTGADIIVLTFNGTDIYGTIAIPDAR